MEGPQRVAEGPVTGARGDGVKTKNGCEMSFGATICSPEGVVDNYFSENSSDLGHYFLASPHKM